MAPRKSEALPKPQTVAYLVANVERLTGTGAFARHQAARTVFLHLCCHPGGNAPPPDKQPSWACPVAAPHHEPGVIAKATGLTIRAVELALDWLGSGGFIHQERDGKSRKRYGPVTIVATHWLSDWKRTQFAMQPLPPAIGTQFATNELSSLNGSATTPKRPRRTVAATRSTSVNGFDLDRSDTLEASSPGRVPCPPADTAPARSATPVERPGIQLATTADTAASGVPGSVAVPEVARLSGTHTGGADAEVDRVMALLSDLPGWDTTAVAVGA